MTTDKLALQQEVDILSVLLVWKEAPLHAIERRIGDLRNEVARREAVDVSQGVSDALNDALMQSVETTPPADERAELESFTEWLCREMPPDTVIGDPKWWAPRIARALRRSDGARIAELEREREIARGVEQTAVDRLNALTARAEAAEACEKGLREKIKPFVDFGKRYVDRDGWNISGQSVCRERIVDHFGPSDFREVAALAQKEPGNG